MSFRYVYLEINQNQQLTLAHVPIFIYFSNGISIYTRSECHEIYSCDTDITIHIRNSYYSNDFIISSCVLHFVSGINKMMNTAPHTQMPANSHMLPWNPISSFSSGKYFLAMNESSHSNDMQNDTAPSFIFCGIISAEKTENY